MDEKSVKDCAVERLDLLVLRLDLERDLVLGQYDNRIKIMSDGAVTNQVLVSAYHLVLEYYESRRNKNE